MQSFVGKRRGEATYDWGKLANEPGSPPKVRGSGRHLSAEPHLPYKVDTHYHFLPQVYRAALEKAGGDPSGWPTPDWSPEASLQSMVNNGIQKAILSLTAPGASIAPDIESARVLAREINNYAASLHGVTLFTRLFTPIWEELNARKAIVFIHPTHPVNTTWTNPILPQPVIDYPHETTRTAVDLVISNVTQKFPDCPKILSHAGGSLPYLISRIATTSKATESTELMYGKPSQEIKGDFQSFYYDLALSSSPAVLNMVLDLVPNDHITYGSDFPYADSDKIAGFREDLDAFHMGRRLRETIYRRNMENPIRSRKHVR
ncbi:hypothetical protein BJX63DRAFT_424277 [Aspergillus granulosus]|uniref:6-methylsalicylate decarboxylase n=1 Tax=Aspergillus granulosus TaxID=176169 RepID=A0ABR4H064_9EURO